MLASSKAAHALGVPYYEFGARTAPSTSSGSLGTVGWMQRHALPWLARRLRRRSTGDGRGAKLPGLIAITPPQ